MKKIIALAACGLIGSYVQAQNVIVNLKDGSQVSYERDLVKNIEFNPIQHSDTLHFATTDMAWSEFYAGELCQSASSLEADGVDVFTSATSGKATRFSACLSSEDGRQILGVKAVSVAIPEALYKALSVEEKRRFSFVEDTLFSEYKLLKSDGSFSAYNSTPVAKSGVTVSLNAGAFSWGNYGISLSGDITRDDIPSANLQGAIITTSNGQKYALTPLNNLWLNTLEMAFCVKEFVEPHGNHPAYTHTAGLQGKTITNITYLLKGMDNVSIDCNLYVKQQNAASLSLGASPAGKNPIIAIAFDNVPTDANYTLAIVKKGSGRSAQVLAEEDYSYKDGSLTLNGEVESGTSFSVTFNSDKYISLTSSITITEEGQATEFQKKLAGTYVELFSEEGIVNAKWDSLWISECAKAVGDEESAVATANYLKNSMLGDLTGAEATKKYGDCSNGFTEEMQFSCHFQQGVSRFVFEGRRIKGLDAKGNEIFSHTYSNIAYNATYDFHYYKSDDDNEDEFTYFFLRSDNPIDTYHIEFRYGDSMEGATDYCGGKYAYWLAAGVLENDDAQCEKSIKLFVQENTAKK
ncbi:MAG: hypothetical protein J6Y37_10865 [Paludibacteraceae bacterium]|nr:hypothetical protein [Paludibacteraceae bacterium]